MAGPPDVAESCKAPVSNTGTEPSVTNDLPPAHGAASLPHAMSDRPPVSEAPSDNVEPGDRPDHSVDGAAGDEQTAMDGNGASPLSDPSTELTADSLTDGTLTASDEKVTLHMKWAGKSFELSLVSSDLVDDLRSAITALTAVPPEAQKILGLVRGKLGTDTDALRLADAGIKDGARFQLVGTPVDQRFKTPTIPPPEDEFDITYPAAAPGGGYIPPALDPRNIRKVQELVAKYPINVMNEPRSGKRLLVLDIDYTLVDTRPLLDGALPPMECARPGLHAFLERVYPHYDIVMWSQTHWRWLETKLVELGVIGGDAAYKVSFVTDSTTMFSVFSLRNNQWMKHQVKALAYIWASFPQWSSKNTIHIDDLSRNGALNPGEILRNAGTLEGEADRELDKLGAYLEDIAAVEDFTTLDHSRWKKRRREHRDDGGGNRGGTA